MNEQTCFRPIYFPTNKGLGNALKEALKNCNYSLIARMDSDDISAPNRFEIQLERFINNPKVDIVGGYITEFVGEESNITGQRVVPSTDKEIKKYMRHRCAMNHMTVMYKKDSVLAAGGYLDWPWNEDYYLWIRMMEAGCIFENISINLVNVRTGAEMSARRGGWKYFKSEKGIQKYMLDHQIIGFPQYLYNVAIRFTGEIIAPNFIRSKLFKFMRKPYNPNQQTALNNCTNVSKKKDYPPFSVAMSVYGKDKAEWLDRALESITVCQTVKPSEIVLIVDGPIPIDVKNIIDKYVTICRTGKVSC